MASTTVPERVFFDAGVFIGALTGRDHRHAEARKLVEQARTGAIHGVTSTGILSEVYATMTWQGTTPAQEPAEAARAVALLILPPSQI